MTRFAHVIRVVVLLAGLGCSIVDETGYGDTDRAGNEAGTDTPPESDAGGLATVFATAEQPVGDHPAPVLIVGLPGSIEDGQVVTASVEGGPSVEGAEDGTSFTVQLDAAVGDVVTVRADGAAIASVVIAAVDADDAPALGAVEETEDDTVAPGSDQIAVGDGDLSGIDAPYLVFNPDRGGSRRVERGEVGVTLTVAQGERLCVAPVAAGAVGAATCRAR